MNAFFIPQPIPPQPALSELRGFVLARSETRSPKWKFQLAPDLVVQIQAKLLARGAERFVCSAVMGNGASTEMLTTSKEKKNCCSISFEIRTETPNDWFVKPRSSSWPKGFQYGDQSISPSIQLRDRVVGALRAGRFSAAPSLARMLSSHCICCGKGLIDPVSMARHIGPECYGSASDNLPFAFKLADDQPTDTPDAAPPSRILRGYQQRSATWLYEHDAAFMIAPLGAGKGAAALTAFADLVRDGYRRHALVVAPKLVATTVWPAEIASWPHLEHLRIEVLNGNPERRRALLAGALDSR
jgi:hypothetical protein